MITLCKGVDTGRGIGLCDGVCARVLDSQLLHGVVVGAGLGASSRGVLLQDADVSNRASSREFGQPCI